MSLVMYVPCRKVLQRVWQIKNRSHQQKEQKDSGTTRDKKWISNFLKRRFLGLISAFCKFWASNGRARNAGGFEKDEYKWVGEFQAIWMVIGGMEIGWWGEGGIAWIYIL